MIKALLIAGSVIVNQPDYTPYHLPYQPYTGAFYTSDGNVILYTTPAPPWGWYPLTEPQTPWGVTPVPAAPLDIFGQ